jgi:DHA1 family bicyclomycin/chloramphenicol resistance-like MFS transporter
MQRNYRAVITRADFLLLASAASLNFAGFFVYVATAPAFLAKLDVTTWGFAWLFMPMIAGIMLGATLSGRLAGRISAHRQITLGYGCMAGGAALNALIVATVPPGVPWHVIPIGVFTVGSSLCAPSLTLLLLDLYPATRGLASSLQGFVQFAFSGVIAGTIAPFLAESLGALAAGMGGFTLLSYALWRVYSARNPSQRSKELIP